MIKDEKKDGKPERLSIFAKIQYNEHVFVSNQITPNYMDTGKQDCNIRGFAYVEVSGISCIMTWMVAHNILAFRTT